MKMGVQWIVSPLGDINVRNSRLSERIIKGNLDSIQWSGLVHN